MIARRQSVRGAIKSLASGSQGVAVFGIDQNAAIVLLCARIRYLAIWAESDPSATLCEIQSCD